MRRSEIDTTGWKIEQRGKHEFYIRNPDGEQPDTTRGILWLKYSYGHSWRSERSARNWVLRYLRREAKKLQKKHDNLTRFDGYHRIINL
jgi:hypothetical protein